MFGLKKSPARGQALSISALSLLLVGPPASPSQRSHFVMKERPDKRRGQLRPTPLEEAIAREVINKQIADRKLAEF